MNGCGHRCCEIPSNSYHTHLGEPSGCGRCADRPEPPAAHEPEPEVTMPVPAVVEPPPGDDGENASRESYLLGRVVADVLTRVAPQIPGLPTGTELNELVASHALALYASGIVEPDLQNLDERERRTVLATRVGLALAFPLPAGQSATQP
jgi:hypothetical protein